MQIDQLIARINALAHKARTEGLTPEEISERTQLREQYIAAFRRSLTAQLDNTYIVGPDGSKRKLQHK